ncbi:MAG: hypothetical protein ACLFM1_08895, partial [Bacteroidales bacterium]
MSGRFLPDPSKQDISTRKQCDSSKEVADTGMAHFGRPNTSQCIAIRTGINIIILWQCFVRIFARTGRI